jgi:hypothetical protein
MTQRSFGYWGFGSRIHLIDREHPLCNCRANPKKVCTTLVLSYDNWVKNPQVCLACLRHQNLPTEPCPPNRN